VPRTAGTVDAFARKRGKHMVTVRIFAGGAAERAGERRPPAESRDRDSGIGGAAAIDHEEAVRCRFGVGLGKTLHPEHFVEHDDPGA
jgi:hypothetical protein